MPYDIIHRSCKQSDGNKGTHVVVKKKGSKTEQVSCHTSKAKAESAVRAKHSNEGSTVKITKKQLRRLIREVIIDEAGYPGWRGGGSATRDYGYRPSRFEYNVGDIVRYRTLSGGERTVKVDARVTPYKAQEDLAKGIEYDPDGIKNGKPGFDGTVISGKEKGRQTWGYDADILGVES